DLEDFFPSINFGRVYGMFKAVPYSLKSEVATVFAQIACYKNALPQGAPTSPTISNMICSKLDGEMQRFAKQHRCTYTRYADDITFSTNINPFPLSVAELTAGKVSLSTGLAEIITRNGFKVNEKKSRLQPFAFRQEVTGLVVNQFVNVKRNYIRNIRSALYKWEKLGIDKVSDEYFARYCPDHKRASTKDFKKVIRGKLEHIRMVRDNEIPEVRSKRLAVFYSLLDRFHVNNLRDFTGTVIRTEGKTDWMHLSAAFSALRDLRKFKDLQLDFYTTHDHLFYGSKNQNKFCEKVKNGKIRPFNSKIICVFDRDEGDIIKNHGSGPIKDWGGNVFSLLLPETGLDGLEYFSVELLYDEKILLKEVDGFRLFLSSEFNPDGRHKRDLNIRFKGNLDALKKPLWVIDSDVIDENTRKNIALSKWRFANAVHRQVPSFENIDFSKFEKLFEIIERVK
ncbi:MAG: reverse transcriptase domain-containing protein, partial [Oligoflexia bacterium]|nr:reverse transcriptase domain-containing protein [Oligoflexia bacterium]